ncbi:MAG: hypothetical protein LBC61_05140 [Candidatus Peribacteria bacterium]|nr:hypothetical protein [Candidatus Peribacteria bacterium]
MFHEVRITYEYYNQSCLQTTYTCGRIENWGNCEVNMNDKTCTQKVESYTEKRCEAR